MNPEDLKMLVPAFLRIWNHPDNLRFLSFTKIEFEEKWVREWCGGHIAVGVRYFGATDPHDRFLAILLTGQNPLEGFELMSIGVEPAEKRRGIGTALIRHGVELARQERYQAIEGKVFATNAPMLSLLLGEEFLPVRIEPRRGPVGEDLVHLRRYL